MLTNEAKRRIVKFLHDSAKSKEEEDTLKGWMDHGASISVPEKNTEMLAEVKAMSPESPVLQAEGYHHVFVHASPELCAGSLAQGIVEIWLLREFQHPMPR